MINEKQLVEKARQLYEKSYFIREDEFLKIIDECIEESNEPKTNSVWESIFKKYIECYESVETLSSNSLIDEEQIDQLRFNLLEDIITTFRSEVED